MSSFTFQGAPHGAELRRRPMAPPRRNWSSCLFALLIAATPAAAQVTINLSRGGDDVQTIRLERSDMPGRWRPVKTFEVQTCEKVCTYTDEHAPGTAAYRAVYIDGVGNESAPGYVVQTAPTCRWEGKSYSVPIECGDDPCDCKAVTARLQAAAEEIYGHSLVEPQVLAGALQGLRVRVVSTPVFNAPKGEKALGLYDVDAHLIVMNVDGCSALHEIMHAVFAKAGIDAGPEGHAPWEASSLLRELDERFMAKWRGKSLWAHPRH